MEITTNKPITEELLQIVKDSFEEQKNIQVLSLYVEEDKIHGIYILPLQQSLSFTTEPLLDMSTDINGHTIIMEELGQILLYAYNVGAIDYYLKLIHSSDIYISNKKFNELIDICVDNPPLQRIDANLIDWLTRYDEVHPIRTQSFVRVCSRYNQLDSLDFDNTISTDTHDNAYILYQFEKVAEQLQKKDHQKITELIISRINDIYIRLQIDLYITDDK